MKHISIKYPAQFLFACILIAACGNRHAAPSSEDVRIDESPLPEEVTSIVSSITDNDASRFASHVRYPLVRPYPLRNIEDSVQMVAYFPIVVDDSIRSIVRDAARKDWSEAGWRGWTLDAGQYLWIEDKLYSMPYLSDTEKNMLEVAISRDMESIAPELREGWEPTFCLVGTDDHTLYRVDYQESTGKYRMLVYPEGVGLGGNPSGTFFGEMETEGSAANRIYTFRSESGDTMEYDYDDTGEGTSLTSVHGDEPPRRIAVSPVYWLDYARCSK